MVDIDEQEQIQWVNQVDNYIRQVHFFANGLYVLCTTSGGKVYAFHHTGTTLFVKDMHKGAIIASSISHEHQLLATGGEDGSFFLSRLTSGEIVYRFDEPGQWIELVSFSPKGNWVAFACKKKVYILNEKGEHYNTIPSKQTISALSWHEDNTTLAIGFFGGVLLYNLANNDSCECPLPKNAILSLTISPDKRFVCCSTQDCQVHIWPLPLVPGNELTMSGFPTKVKCLHWHYEGNQLATNSGQMVVIWDFSGEGPANKQPEILKGHLQHVTSIAFQHGNDLLVSGDKGGLLLFFYPAKSNYADYTIYVEEEVTALSWSPDDKKVLVGTAGGNLLMIENPVEGV